MTRSDRLILSALAAGVWALAVVWVAGPDTVRAQFSTRSIQAIVEKCRVEGDVTGRINGRAEGTVAGEVQVQQGNYGVIQNGRIVFATVSGRLDQGRLEDGRIVCSARR